MISDVANMEGLVAHATDRGGFHLVVVDPPWKNKSILRSNKYGCLTPPQLLEMPVRAMLAAHCNHGDATVVAVWVTNNERYRRFVLTELFPHWGVDASTAAAVHWLKVTNSGAPIGPLNGHRRPYETVLIGIAASPASELYASAAARLAALASLPQVIIAVPGGHSRKPLLLDFLCSLLPSEPRCLELFARSTNTNFLSWGNEAIVFQGSAQLPRK
eukprot:TRINITY_DN15168_c0_g1_i1.p2 TRINITY_DN15168_c0_g1~~TRINITY_DN15168_c0_g1_i1.p2  ORF type:complete len:216 (-),score=31.29 TRINITY_DN15168_c0_g1_i1:14-661(-)